MAILQKKVKTTSSEVLVMCEDPDVAPKDPHARGWIPRSAAMSVGGDADIVEVRPLNIDEDAETGGIAGHYQRTLAQCRAGIVRVNGSRSRKVKDAWLAQFRGVHRSVYFLLGLYIEALTNGIDDIQDVQRRYLVDDDEEDRSPEGGSKSGDMEA